MFSPTDVKVTVRQGRNLLVKAKSGINDAYAIIEFCKEKYSTSTEKSLTPRWLSECTFALPQGGVFNNKVVVNITVHHKRHAKLGFDHDEFLGQVQIPLSALNSSDAKERTRWYNLSGKKKESKKERGEIEVSFKFISQEKVVPILPKESPKPLRILTSGLRSKLRRRSEDEDSGVGINDSLGRGRSYENLSTPVIVDNHQFERKFRSSSTNSSPGGINSARGSGSFPISSLPSKSRAVSVEVLNRPHSTSSSLRRSNSGGGVDSEVKQHARNMSAPQSELNHLHEVKTYINGNHLDVPGSHENEKKLSSSLDDVNGRQIETVSKRSLNATNKRHSMMDIDKLRSQNIYKKKDLYRLDVKELRKVSTIHEDVSPTYQSLSHAQLVKLCSKQSEMLSKKDIEIKELENYIDKLLFRVMIATPQILEDKFPQKLDYLTKF